MPRTYSKQEAIDLLRSELLKLTDDDNSICKVAADRGIFCKGFQRYSEGGLRRRYEWLQKQEPEIPRDELEDRANHWQLARQELHEAPLACDVQQKEHDVCGGW